MTDLPRIDAQTIVREAEELFAGASPANTSLPSVFEIKPVNDWIDQAIIEPIPKSLFGDFWFEGEVCLLYADTNVGKSILATQIQEAIASGRPILGVGMEAEAQKTVYFDFELNRRQFAGRYSEREPGADFLTNPYRFSGNFLRAEFKPRINVDLDDEELLKTSLDQAVRETGAKVVVVDNLTYLDNEMEKAKSALPLMKFLQQGLADRYGVSILALGHTPKRDRSRPISENDLSGSKMLLNFCDSSFVLAESNLNPNLRYIKQIKARSVEKKYGTSNVMLCMKVKEGNYLHFKFDIDGPRFSSEWKHLKDPSEGDRSDEKARLAEEARKLKSEGLSQRDIAERLDVSPATVNRALKSMSDD